MRTIYLCTYVYVLSAALPYLNLHRGRAIQIDRKKDQYHGSTTITTCIQVEWKIGSCCWVKAKQKQEEENKGRK